MTTTYVDDSNRSSAPPSTRITVMAADHVMMADREREAEFLRVFTTPRGNEAFKKKLVKKPVQEEKPIETVTEKKRRVRVG